jgi:hypothetical protein
LPASDVLFWVKNYVKFIASGVSSVLACGQRGAFVYRILLSLSTVSKKCTVNRGYFNFSSFTQQAFSP